MHHFKTKEFHHRVRRKQGQRNQWERCCGNHCCCWAASAPCSQAALRLLGCYRSQLPPFRCFHSPNLKLIKKKKYIPTFHPFPLSTICTVRLGRQIINPRPNFLDWLTLETRCTNFPIFQYFTKVLLKSHFPTCPDDIA